MIRTSETSSNCSHLVKVEDSIGGILPPIAEYYHVRHSIAIYPASGNSTDAIHGILTSAKTYANLHKVTSPKGVATDGDPC